MVPVSLLLPLFPHIRLMQKIEPLEHLCRGATLAWRIKGTKSTRVSALSLSLLSHSLCLYPFALPLPVVGPKRNEFWASVAMFR